MSEEAVSPLEILKKYVIEDGDNPRKIPKTVFLEEASLRMPVEDWVQKYDAKKILEFMNELYRKYKFMES